MYNSLKAWINVPYQLKPCTGRAGTGTKTFGDTVSLLCYPASDIKLVTNELGAEVTSTTQLYIDGSTTIACTDEVIFEEAQRPIQRISTYYRNGAPDIKVVYL